MESLPTRSHVMPVPRDRAEKALVEALIKDGLSHLRTVAVSVRLSSTRRFYKDFRNLRLAIVAKNRGIRKQRVHRPQKCFASLGPESCATYELESKHRKWRKHGIRCQRICF
jgi:hypothetical protein